jgi:hypothetical protein
VGVGVPGSVDVGVGVGSKVGVGVGSRVGVGVLPATNSIVKVGPFMDPEECGFKIEEKELL